MPLHEKIEWSSYCSSVTLVPTMSNKYCMKGHLLGLAIVPGFCFYVPPFSFIFNFYTKRMNSNIFIAVRRNLIIYLLANKMFRKPFLSSIYRYNCGYHCRRFISDAPLKGKRLKDFLLCSKFGYLFNRILFAKSFAVFVEVAREWEEFRCVPSC